ncbi:AsnC family transcriptional regulator [Corynebacterium sp. 35RC1]|nr:AsnC family transcriptional regulator [Corynebacterium sp. 35RC1]
MRHVVFDPLDKQLITCIQQDPLASFGQWALQLGVSANTVARRFQRLQSQNIVHVIGRTAPNFGGHQTWLVRFRGGAAHTRAVIPQLVNMLETRWVRVSRDRTEVFCGVVGNDQTLGRALAAAGNLRTSTHQLLHLWGGSQGPVLDAPLDAEDEHLLHLLAENGRLSNVALAEQLGVDAATVSRRRKRLQGAGILYYEAVVSPQVFSSGHDVHLWLNVAPGFIEAVGRHLRDAPEVGFVAATAGTSAIVANVTMLGDDEGLSLIRFVDSLSNLGVFGYEIIPMGATLKGYVPTR